MNPVLPSDHAMRAAALDASRSFIVQAPAGSGKTELLTDRILALLARVRRPEEILAITFTRKAASEMHARVLAKLAAARGPCPAAAHERQSWMLASAALQQDAAQGWNLLQYPARLGIRTIDAFCSGLVRSMPWLSGTGGMPQLTDRPGRHYEAAALATLAMIGEDAAVAHLLEHLDVNQNRAVTLMAEILGARDQWLPWLAHGADFEALSHNLDASICEALAQLSALMPAGWAAAVGPALGDAAATLAQDGKGRTVEVLLDWDGQPFGAGRESLPYWQALAAIVLTQGGALRKKVDRRVGFAPDSPFKATMMAWLGAMPADAPWVDALWRVTRIPAENYTAAQRTVIQNLLRVLLVLAAQLQLVFREAGEIDFIEMAQRARRALGEAESPSELMLRLDNALSHILLDEFQDTSQAQIDLLEALTAGWMPGDGRSLFLVGDPMQSIYRFREAEVGLFLTVREQGLGALPLEFLELNSNFRSHASLVDDINRFFATVFPQENNAGLGAIRYSPSTAYWQGRRQGRVQFHPVWHRKQTGARRHPRLDAIVDTHVVALAAQALEQNIDSAHPVAILVRARTHLGKVVQRLQEHGLPCRAVELDSLDQRMLVLDLVQLARALAHPADRMAWLAVLRSPLCGMRLVVLHALFGRNHERLVPEVLRDWRAQGMPDLDVMTPQEIRILAQVAAALLDERNASGRLPFAARVEHCWQRLGGPALCADDADRADVEQVFGLIERLAPWGALNPAELEDSLADLRAASIDGGRAVEVMTIHKAKGLEFETVILMGLEKPVMGDRQPLLRFEHSEGRLLLGPVKRSIDDANDPISAYIADREAARAAYERERVLYVAMTRACRDLHIVARVAVNEAGEAQAPSASTLLACLWDGLPLTAVPSWDSLCDLADAGSGEQGARLLQQPVDALAPDAAAADLVPTVAVSTSGPAAWTADGSAARERILGTVAHAWLERMGHDGPHAWPPARLAAMDAVFARQLSRAGMAAGALDAAVAVLRETLLATLSSERGRWLLSLGNQAYREWSLLGLDGRVSIIDLAVSREQDWLVVDYKTGCPRDGESVTQFAQRMRALHADQLARYCRHVSALDGRPARAALFFPRADLWVDLS